MALSLVVSVVAMTLDLQLGSGAAQSASVTHRRVQMSLNDPSVSSLSHPLAFVGTFPNVVVPLAPPPKLQF